MLLNTETILEHYIIAALWSSTDESTPAGGEPMDANYTADDIAPETRTAMESDVRDFVDYISPILGNHDDDLEEYGRRHGINEMIGHDFWLTRNRRGAGFWDRGLGELGDELTDAAKTFGSCDLYIGDDGKVHAS